MQHYSVKKSVKAGAEPKVRPPFLCESPPPDLAFQRRPYFLANMTDTECLTRASLTGSCAREGS